MDITLQRIMSLVPKDANGFEKHGAYKEFATSIGFKSGAIISSWKSGASDTYKNYLYQIAAVYGVSVEWLKGETDEKNPTADGDGKEKGILDDLTEVELLQVKDYIEFIKSKRS